MTGAETDVITALAFFVVICTVCAIGAWIGDMLTSFGTRRLDQARSDLARYAEDDQ